MELPSVPAPPDSAAQPEALLPISWLPEDSYTPDEVLQKIVTFLSPDGFILRKCYWEFLDDRRRCGILYHERAKCYTWIVNTWLLFLEVTPDPNGPDLLDHWCQEWRKIMLANWSQFLSKCVPGDKDLVCRLHDFTLDKACKEDVERVIARLKVGLQGYPS